MQSSLRMFKQIFSAILVFISITSLGYAQEFRPQEREKAPAKTVQIFAEDDDPSAWVPGYVGEFLRQREVTFNPVFLKELGSVHEGDKLAGFLFDDKYLEALVSHVKEGSQGLIYAHFDGYKGFTEIRVWNGKISLRVDFDDPRKYYYGRYDEKEARHIIREIEPDWARRERIEKAVAAARAAGPKTIQLFAEDDDPANRLALDTTEDERQHWVRWRRASINPQLLGDRFKEIIIGDTITGQLFEDEYFEGVVASLPEKGDFRALAVELKIKGEDNSSNTLLFGSGTETISLTIRDKTRKREFSVGSNGRTPYHVVVERDSSKVKILPCDVGGARSDSRKSVNSSVANKKEQARKSEPKTIQLFAEDDDPASRLPWDESDPEYRELKSFLLGLIKKQHPEDDPDPIFQKLRSFALDNIKRRRKASVNPQLFADRFDEINIGDTIAGYLFEDEYFEGVVIGRPEGGQLPSLRLQIKGDENTANWVNLISDNESIHLYIHDQSRKKKFRVSTNERIPYHVVIEEDLSKRPPFRCGVRALSVDRRKVK